MNSNPSDEEKIWYNGMYRIRTICLFVAAIFLILYFMHTSESVRDPNGCVRWDEAHWASFVKDSTVFSGEKDGLAKKLAVREEELFAAGIRDATLQNKVIEDYFDQNGSNVPKRDREK